MERSSVDDDDDERDNEEEVAAAGGGDGRDVVSGRPLMEKIRPMTRLARRKRSQDQLN